MKRVEGLTLVDETQRVGKLVHIPRLGGEVDRAESAALFDSANQSSCRLALAETLDDEIAERSPIALREPGGDDVVAEHTHHALVERDVDEDVGCTGGRTENRKDTLGSAIYQREQALRKCQIRNWT